MIRAEIVLDSLNVVTGDRLTTFLLTYPRFIHSELMTHRMFSRNAASSRAIPLKKTIEEVTRNPAMPIEWGKNQSGMQATTVLEVDQQVKAAEGWRMAAVIAAEEAENLAALGLHKQIVNRVLEPFMWMTTLVTATDYGNFFALRCHKDAQPEFQKLADAMLRLYVTNEPLEVEPRPCKDYEVDTWSWHMPFIEQTDMELDFETRRRVSVARCARTSYVAMGNTSSVEEDIVLHDKLLANGHWSPFEHIAQARPYRHRYANFHSWRQYRLHFPGHDRQCTDLRQLATERGLL